MFKLIFFYSNGLMRLITIKLVEINSLGIKTQKNILVKIDTQFLTKEEIHQIVHQNVLQKKEAEYVQIINYR